jgi:hypothetical protein
LIRIETAARVSSLALALSRTRVVSVLSPAAGFVRIVVDIGVVA